MLFKNSPLPRNTHLTNSEVGCFFHCSEQTPEVSLYRPIKFSDTKGHVDLSCYSKRLNIVGFLQSRHLFKSHGYSECC